jgi:hypothetical protein
MTRPDYRWYEIMKMVTMTMSKVPTSAAILWRGMSFTFMVQLCNRKMTPALRGTGPT